MTSKIYATAEIKLTKEEKESIDVVMKLLNDLITTFGEKAMIKSISTGEVIEIEELLRTRGILDGLNYIDYRVKYR